MKVKIKDVADIKHGFAFSGEYISEEDNGIVLVTPGNFSIGGGFQEEKCKFYTGEIPSEYELKADDLIVTMTDLSKGIDTLGYGALVPNTNDRIYLHNQRIGLVEIKSPAVDKGYLARVLQTRDYQRTIAGSSSGSTVHHTSPSKIGSFSFELPDLKIQKRISDVLFAYDELIESNRRQIKLLEEAAQRLYKEWFIDLKFPGHETTSIVDGLPEGWKRTSLRSFLVSHIGGGWGKESNESAYPIQAAVVRATDMDAIRNGNVKDVPVRWHSVSNFQKRKLEAGDIVFEVSGGSKEAGVGRSILITEDVLNLFDGPIICASFCKRMHLADSASSALLYWKIRNDLKAGLIRKYEKSSAGNIINFLWDDFLDGYELLIPSDQIKEQFGSAANAYSKALGIRYRQISLAREARDRLLPKLMSGEIGV